MQDKLSGKPRKLYELYLDYAIKQKSLPPFKQISVLLSDRPDEVKPNSGVASTETAKLVELGLISKKTTARGKTWIKIRGLNPETAENIPLELFDKVESARKIQQKNKKGKKTGSYVSINHGLKRVIPDTQEREFAVDKSFSTPSIKKPKIQDREIRLISYEEYCANIRPANAFEMALLAFGDIEAITNITERNNLRVRFPGNFASNISQNDIIVGFSWLNIAVQNGDGEAVRYFENILRDTQSVKYQVYQQQKRTEEKLHPKEKWFEYLVDHENGVMSRELPRVFRLS